MDLVSTRRQVEINIENFGAALEVSSVIQSRGSNFIAWFALKIGSSYLLAPSKFIAYKDIDARKYERLSTHVSGIDGRESQPHLVATGFFSEITATSPMMPVLSNELAALLEPYGKKPNSRLRMYMLTDQLAEETGGFKRSRLFDLVAAVIADFPPAEKEALRELL